MRANALKEVELKIISPEEYRSRFGQISLQQAKEVQVPTNAVTEKLKATSPIGFFDEMKDFFSNLITFLVYFYLFCNILGR